MKKILLVTVALQLVCPALLARADVAPPQVLCTGSENGGSGPRQYAYEVDADGFAITEFMVGTNDLNSDNYTNLLIPENWNFAIEQVGMAHAHGTKTPHGSISLGPCYCLTYGRVRWWTEDVTNAVGSFTFGYDHPWFSEDVGWGLSTPTTWMPWPPEFYEHWQAPVGTGFGPVHGPLPEPATLGLMLMGGLALLRRRHRLA